MFALKFASLFILAYLLGSFPTGILVGKPFSIKTLENTVQEISGLQIHLEF